MENNTNENGEPNYFKYYDADIRRRRNPKLPLIILLVLIAAVLGVTGWLLWCWFYNGSLPF